MKFNNLQKDCTWKTKLWFEMICSKIESETLKDSVQIQVQAIEKLEMTKTA